MPLFRNYDQAGLDAQYNLRVRHPEFQDFFDKWARENPRVRERLECRLDVAYGPTPEETVDIFPAARPGGPVNVFIHGGYWQALGKDDFSFVAEPLAAAGVATVVVNYALAPAVTMDEIVRQARAAIAWTHAHAADFGADPNRLYVSGHSAGGHLTGEALLTDWPAFAGLPADTVKGGYALSGLFELEPIRLCYLNENLHLDEDAAARYSPLLYVAGGKSQFIVAVGSEESDEFLRHAAEMATAWEQAGNAAEHLVLPGLNHFSIVDVMGDPASPLVRSLLAQMGVG